MASGGAGSLQPSKTGSTSLPPNSLINSQFRRFAREMRVILIGKTGSGKSSTGNTILGGTPFNAQAGGTSGTRNCSFSRACVQNRNIMIVDTPGLFDSHLSQEETHAELIRCIGLAAPGPHVFILTVPANIRITPEERSSLDLFKNTFGESMVEHSMILFTKADEMKRQLLNEKQFLKKLPEEVASFLKLCKGGHIFFDNYASREMKQKQVEDLLCRLEYIVDKNGSKCYSNEQFEIATKMIITKRKERQSNVCPQPLHPVEEELDVFVAQEEKVEEQTPPQVEEEINDQDRQEYVDNGGLFHALIESLKSFWNRVKRLFYGT